MGPRQLQTVWLDDPDPLTVALRLDDARSEYCDGLEKLVARQAAEIAELRALVASNPRREGSF
jgi:hypothetical protein